MQRPAMPEDQASPETIRDAADDTKCLVGKLYLGHMILGTQLWKAEIVGRGLLVGDHYDDHVLGFHIPDGAIVPEPILEDMWLVGRLAGKKKNRVKARYMHGYLSDGLFYGSQYRVNGELIVSRNWNPDWTVGHDVSAELGITFSGG